MTRYAGRDISQKETTICIVDEQGRLWRGTALTDPELVSHYGSDLRRSGLEVVCLDARRAKAARPRSSTKVIATMPWELELPAQGPQEDLRRELPTLERVLLALLHHQPLSTLSPS